MKVSMKLIALSALLLCGAQAQATVTNADYNFEPTMHVASIGATLHISNTEASLDEVKATELMNARGNYGTYDAYVQQADNANEFIIGEVLYQNIELGYLTTDDWDTYMSDTSALLNAIKENTRRDNALRTKQGIDMQLLVTNWLIAPSLDRTTNTIMWATKGKSTQPSTGTTRANTNIVTLQLTRNGVIKTTVIPVSASTTIEAKSLARKATNAMQLDFGKRYGDFIPSKDTMAKVGIGALSYKLLTGKTATKVAKGAGLGIIAVLFKKFFFVMFIVPFLLVKKLFTKKK